MNRITTRTQTGYKAPDQQIDAALERLGKLEDLWQEIEQQQLELSGKMQALRAAGKQNTVKFRELMVKKLNNATILAAFQSRGL